MKESDFSTCKTESGFHAAKFPEWHPAWCFAGVTIQNDDDDDWRGVQRAFNKILVQRARMNNRPCKWAGRPSWWRAREDENIYPIFFGFFTPDAKTFREIIRLKLHPELSDRVYARARTMHDVSKRGIAWDVSCFND